MIIYPAIDLKDGKCVRLYKGDMDKATVYNEDPVTQAIEWSQAGFSWLHVVDLNGAIQGKPVNGAAVEAILNSVSIPVQLGGGIRDLKQIDHWIQAGVSRVILGTAAVKNPQLVVDACDHFPGQIALSIDAKGMYVATEGWVESSGLSAINLIQEFSDLDLAAIIYTDIDRDGTGEGLNMANTIKIAQSTRIPVIASGGVGSIDDVFAVREAQFKGVTGMIIGKALYDGRIDPREALAAAVA
jgi:phosphoribosylformimino-5-aminoimidazole carboxamide ribotide isomerase